MSKLRRSIAVVVMAGIVSMVGASAAFAGKPGPGSKQCTPGQQGNPHPAHKAGVCPNPGK
ncbi:MAG TPA: hypothetical protein VG602_00870 [Actinomycetota bacterium]|nr:hypothetical protein [Actinomycetota bacterium]